VTGDVTNRAIELFAFEFFDPMRKRRVRACYKATREVIAAQYVEYRLIGEPELRERGDPAGLTAGHVAKGPI
jgi:hypothetical protein